MIRVAVAIALGALVLAQQPRVQQEELGKPGQAQTAQPAKPAAAPAPQQQPAPKTEPAAPAAQAQPAAPPAAQPTQPAPAAAPPAAATEPQKPQQQSLVQHTPASEEKERGQAGKPVAAFWTVLPGR